MTASPLTVARLAKRNQVLAADQAVRDLRDRRANLRRNRVSGALTRAELAKATADAVDPAKAAQ